MCRFTLFRNDEHILFGYVLSDFSFCFAGSCHGAEPGVVGSLFIVHQDEDVLDVLFFRCADDKPCAGEGDWFH